MDLYQPGMAKTGQAAHGASHACAHELGVSLNGIKHLDTGLLTQRLIERLVDDTAAALPYFLLKDVVAKLEANKMRRLIKSLPEEPLASVLCRRFGTGPQQLSQRRYDLLASLVLIGPQHDRPQINRQNLQALQRRVLPATRAGKYRHQHGPTQIVPGQCVLEQSDAATIGQEVCADEGQDDIRSFKMLLHLLIGILASHQRALVPYLGDALPLQGGKVSMERFDQAQIRNGPDADDVCRRTLHCSNVSRSDPAGGSMNTFRRARPPRASTGFHCVRWGTESILYGQTNGATGDSFALTDDSPQASGAAGRIDSACSGATYAFAS